ncbi:DUF2726 domain-containing protein [Hymenobacter coccineus]|uniref:DUF2726 domain-containing protein n=1 Tax=Hymenobacter coccineus TaxID=1908235 RepID=A0A1G1SV52_9BACT|nr:DUF2726 domain-containing protein [Hymenobacter coccineus]OGX82510.1 hypothetical protein BEN49_13660 [Hymenobacter coccineus]
MDREAILQAVFKEDWDPVITWLYRNQQDIPKDDLLTYAAGIFAAEFFAKLPTYPLDRPDIDTYLATLWSLHQRQLYVLKPTHHRLLITQSALRNSQDPERAYQFAREFPDDEACQAIIAAYERRRPPPMAHSQSHTIQVTQQPTTPEIPAQEYRITLFKSYQEKQLFQALINNFPSYNVFPNVAISCLLNWETLKPLLTTDERKLFFTGIVDFVIFDRAQDLLPMHFFELDSPHHDTESAQFRDQAKDGIFLKAGVTLHRIRKMDPEVTEREFTLLIRELIQS